MTRQLKVAFLADTLVTDRAGTERHLLEILGRLDRQRFVPLLVTLHGSAWLEEARLPCERVDLGWRGFCGPSAIVAISRLRRLLRERKIDLLHTFFEESVFVAWAAAIGSAGRVRLIASRRDIGLGAEEPWYHGLMRSLRPRVARRFDAIVANGSEVAQYVARIDHRPLEAIQVIPNGVTVDDAPRPVPGQMAAHPDAVWIVAVANLKPVKRIDVLIDAVARLISAGADCRAVVLGEGPERPALEARRDALGLGERLLFPGATRDVRAWLQHASIAVNSSDREGLSNGILEAMSCALPVVATRVGDSGRLVDSSNGRLISPGDPVALASALIELANDPGLRRDLGLCSRQRVDSGYSWAAAITAYERLYMQLSSAEAVVAGEAPSPRVRRGA